MYTLSQISNGIRNPRFAALHFNRRFANSVLEKIRPRTDFFEEDWDNLFILDACRYDIIKNEYFGEGTLEHRFSPGSNSEEFVMYHTNNKTLSDVVWVTANPWVSKHRENIFKVIDVWDFGWDKNLQTVPPKTMREATLNAVNEYPNKRIVAHFMQPHYPFIGKFGRTQLPTHRTFTGGGRVTESEEASIWDQLQAGNVSKKEVWKAYTENLNLALPIVQTLCSEITGRTVISADHGNEMGGRAFPIPIQVYGHPPRLRTKNLVKVPWIIYEDTERRKIIDGELADNTGENREVIKDRLQALGYRE